VKLPKIARQFLILIFGIWWALVAVHSYAASLLFLTRMGVCEKGRKCIIAGSISLYSEAILVRVPTTGGRIWEWAAFNEFRCCSCRIYRGSRMVSCDWSDLSRDSWVRVIRLFDWIRWFWDLDLNLLRPSNPNRNPKRRIGSIWYYYVIGYRQVDKFDLVRLAACLALINLTWLLLSRYHR
jgi:hypothetical protein